MERHFRSYFSEEEDKGDDSFNHPYRMAILCFLAKLCLGSVYGWSFIASRIICEFGFVNESKDDWNIILATYP